MSQISEFIRSAKLEYMADLLFLIIYTFEDERIKSDWGDKEFTDFMLQTFPETKTLGTNNDVLISIFIEMLDLNRHPQKQLFQNVYDNQKILKKSDEIAEWYKNFIDNVRNGKCTTHFPIKVWMKYGGYGTTLTEKPPIPAKPDINKLDRELALFKAKAEARARTNGKSKMTSARNKRSNSLDSPPKHYKSDTERGRSRCVQFKVEQTKKDGKMHYNVPNTKVEPKIQIKVDSKVQINSSGEDTKTNTDATLRRHAIFPCKIFSSRGTKISYL